MITTTAGAFKTVLLMVSVLVATAGSNALAQTMGKQALTLEGAKKAAEAAMAEARRNNAGGAIAVVDDGGSLLYVERLDNTFAAAPNISIGKARTAAIFKKPTSAFEKIINDGRTAMTTLPDFTPLQGGVPIVKEGQVVGAIGVSGAASAQQDEELALAGAKALEGAGTATAPGSQGMKPAAPVSYFDAKTVAAAFAKGAVLVDDGSNMMHAARNYMVHASHREGPGLAEIHELDTDIMYVLEGTATLVTGGTAVDAKPSGPNEIRGTSIRDGETRQLSKGDVVVIPNGVPHWFKEVKGSFNYFVVKAR
jgi:uncharacterized protein GlcG (DUF336 family)/mannose-6-phosphate isomerase-like protein (cupin superfamily)